MIPLPPDLPWPVVGRDPDTLDVLVEGPFLGALRAALGRPPTEDEVAEVLIAWYVRRRAEGADPCPVLEQLRLEIRREDSAERD